MKWTDFYIWYSQFANSIVGPIAQISRGIPIPILAALLLGLAGATAPCQISTNIGAIGYIARYTGDEQATFRQTFAFVIGKILAYTLIGGTVILLGTKMNVISQNLIPVIGVIRKGMGPLFVLSGLVMLGVFSFRKTVGEGIKNKLLQKVPKQGAWGALLLGIIFSLAFCPTLFLLFFGLLVPLGIQSNGGVLFPAVFALGTALPLLLLAYFLAIGGDALKRKFVRQAGKINRIVVKVVAIIFILVGINDTFLYWML
ncbi:urease accessory protein UreH domain-containing protein [Effusibacillus dendaii]|uniref:Cytochrome c biosynthesis protein n=1 Tax=Effusibacillus dendaii TaxID=2743772 RepID=A0A7I8DKC4_9BACL|nr:sulfite exporter TauE/SafE family protein [Effusibacillus dendaii]BCJ88351.1 cytochrome c biosynthesis protein [Effusibacillus dendaii]